ncbi:MAG: TonB-dependent receptor [Steroidobacteraceae bacterium]
MRSAKSTLIGTAVAVALFGANAFAQQGATTGNSQTDANDSQSTGNGDAAPTLQEVVVTGIRYSVKKSLAMKRIATDNVEVLTATDVGRLPAQNVADVLQTMPGVETQSSVAGEGGFAINDRVSLLGVPPLLTQVTVDGHYVSSGDWFVEDQYETVGRSVSFDLFPTTMVSNVTAYESQDPSLLAGGVAGSVDIQTPKPFDFEQGLHGFANAGANYWDLPSKANPQGSLEVSWRNDTVGLLAQVFYQKQSIRRDGQEELGYEAVPHCTAVGGTGCPGDTPGWTMRNPSLPNATGAQIPTLLGEALFEQTEENSGGLLDFQVKPSDTLSVNLTAFYSNLLASNFNDNFMMWGSNFVSPSYVPTALAMQNGTVTGGTWPTEAGAPASIVYDQIMRPDASAKSSFVNLDGAWDASDNLTVDGQLGFTYGGGYSPSQPAYEYDGGNGVSYQMNGLSSLASVEFPGTATNNPAGYGVSWAWNDIVHSIDKETYAKLDATLKLNDGALEDLRVGARFGHHQHETMFAQDQGLNCSGGAPACAPVYSGGEYPGNYQSTLPGGGPWANNIFMDSEAAIEAFDATNLSTGPERYYWLDSFSLEENDTQAYVMADVGGDRWSGNFGVRVENTLEEVLTNVAGGVNPLTFSAFGPFTPTEVDNRYFNVLPSANLKFELTHRLIWRFDASEGVALPDYSTLGGGITLTDTNFTGQGGNPDLQPIKGAAYSTDLEYYYGPESMVEAKIFDMDMSSYVDFGTSTGTYYDSTTKQFAPFAITSPYNIPAEIKGAVLAWDQALPYGFGLNANVTLSNGATSAGGPVLDNSKYTYNVMGYYQQGPLSANLDYDYRSHYYAAVAESSPQNVADAGFLNLQVTYDVLKNLSVTLDARNLTDELIKEYGLNLSQPVAIYNNGRQYYLYAEYKF